MSRALTARVLWMDLDKLIGPLIPFEMTKDEQLKGRHMPTLEGLMQENHKLDEAFVVKGKGGKKLLQAGALFDQPRCVFVPAPMALMMFSKWDTGLDDWQAEAAFKSPDYLAKGLVRGMRSLQEDDPAAFEEHKGLAGEVIALLWAVWSPTTGREGQPPPCA
jgi:hypothetical protein